MKLKSIYKMDEMKEYCSFPNWFNINPLFLYKDIFEDGCKITFIDCILKKKFGKYDINTKVPKIFIHDIDYLDGLRLYIKTDEGYKTQWFALIKKEIEVGKESEETFYDNNGKEIDKNAYVRPY